MFLMIRTAYRKISATASIMTSRFSPLQF